MSETQAFESIHNRNPIYTADQIIIPDELPDIMKAYTKHMLRTKPENMIEASAAYFTRLCNMQNRKRKSLISDEQLNSLYTKLHRRESPTITKEELVALLGQLKVAKELMQDILRYPTMLIKSGKME